MIKYILALFLLSTSVFAFPPDIQRIKDRGVLYVAQLATDTYPFFYVENNTLKGLDIDLAKLIASELEVTLELVTASTFDGTVNLIRYQEADLAISKLSSYPQRNLSLLSSTPYVTLQQALIVNKHNFYEERLTMNSILPDVFYTNESIGVLANTIYHTLAKTNFPVANIIAYDNWDKLIEDLRAGELLLAYRDELEAKKLLRIPDIKKDITILNLINTQDNIVVYTHFSDTHLYYWVNMLLRDKGLNFTVEEILSTY